MLRLFFRGRPFSYKGRFYDLDGITPSPGSVQQPHPPIYMVANNPLSLDAAADQGLPVFMNGAMRLVDLGEAMARYRARAAAAGFDAAAVDIPVNRFVFVGESRAHAHRVMREPFLQFVEHRAPDLRAYLAARFGARAASFELLAREIAIFDDPEGCAQRLYELEDQVGLHHTLCTFNLITLDHRLALESMRRFASEVVPLARFADGALAAACVAVTAVDGAPRRRRLEAGRAPLDAAGGVSACAPTARSRSSAPDGPALGAWLQLGSLPAARLLAAQALVDWLIVDFEHAPVDPVTAAAILGSVSDVSRGRVTPLARVAAGTMACVKHALDAGAQGIVVPMVHGPDEVREALRWARFPPEGERGAGALLAHLGMGIARPDYVAARQRRDPGGRADRDPRSGRARRGDPRRPRRGPLLHRPQRSAPGARLRRRASGAKSPRSPRAVARIRAAATATAHPAGHALP